MTANQPNPPVDRLVREQAIILLDLATLSDVQHAAVAGGDTDALTVVDLAGPLPHSREYVALGSAPESLELSPDGRWLIAVLMNGSHLPPTDPVRGEHGQIVLLERTGRTYVLRDRIEELPPVLNAELQGVRDDLVEVVIDPGKLATYGLRRAVSFDDRAGLAAVAKAGKEKDYRLKDIVEAFVLSDLFRKR